MPDVARLEGAAKVYATDAGDVTALPPVDAVFRAGTITAIVGVSGSGKSTLLRLLSTQELPSEGVVEIAGRSTRTLGRSALRQLRRDEIAHVAQRAADNVFPQLTLGEHGVSEEDLALVGLPGRLRAGAAELSGGELARAAFAVAIARSPRLLVVDEPTAELDRQTAAAVLDALRGASERGAAVVVATHDPEVLRVADDVLELHRPGEHEAAPPLPPHLGTVLLEARGLTKRYGETTAVDDVSLAIREGELATIVGRSGSGKSTLFMLLAGWERPDGGTVSAGRTWAEFAYLPQRFGLVPELDVRENVDLPARLAGERGATDELLAALAIDSLGSRYPHEISVGQQQRVAVARALTVRPRVLLVDEPTSHQDGESAERVWSLLRAAAAEGTACLVATHEPDAAARAHTAWTMADGRLHALE